MSYDTIRTVHIISAGMAVVLLILRLALAMHGKNYRKMGLLHWLPHMVDSVLLGAAVTLAWWSAQYPFVNAWLSAKVIALPLYIISAALALDPNRSSRVRLAGGAMSLLLFTYIVCVARTRQPWPFAI